MLTTIYHNPRCSKSRQTLALLEDKGCDVQIVDYITNPPDPTTLTDILRQLGYTPQELMRTGEKEYQAMSEKLKVMPEAEAITWLCRNPRVLERPIVISSKGARIGRPPETVLEIL